MLKVETYPHGVRWTLYELIFPIFCLDFEPSSRPASAAACWFDLRIRNLRTLVLKTTELKAEREWIFSKVTTKILFFRRGRIVESIHYFIFALEQDILVDCPQAGDIDPRIFLDVPVMNTLTSDKSSWQRTHLLSAAQLTPDGLKLLFEVSSSMRKLVKGEGGDDRLKRKVLAI